MTRSASLTLAAHIWRALCNRWPVSMPPNDDAGMECVAEALRDWAVEQHGKDIPPMPEAVTAYSASIGYPLNGQAFCDFYAMRGWKISSNVTMKDWKAAVRNWKENGWGKPLNVAPAAPKNNTTQASLGALQIQLERVETELESILYPGGAAFKTTPSGERLTRYNSLMEQRANLKRRIDEFSQ